MGGHPHRSPWLGGVWCGILYSALFWGAVVLGLIGGLLVASVGGGGGGAGELDEGGEPYATFVLAGLVALLLVVAVHVVWAVIVRRRTGAGRPSVAIATLGTLLAGGLAGPYVLWPTFGPIGVAGANVAVAALAVALIEIRAHRSRAALAHP